MAGMSRRQKAIALYMAAVYILACENETDPLPECPTFGPPFAGSDTELACYGSWRLLCLHCLDNGVGKFRRSRSATHVSRQLGAVAVYVIERIANFLLRFV